MSIVRKTYMLKYVKRKQMYVRVNGRVVLVEFTNANPHNPSLKGTFTTANPDLIKALEADPGFNVSYSVFHSEETKEAVKETVLVRADPLEVKKQREEQEIKDKLTEAELVMANKPEDLVYDSEAKTETVEETPAEETEEEVKEDNTPEPKSDVVGLEVVKNVQEAKEYLKKLFPELTARELGNKELVLSVATAKGLVFEALNQ